MSRTAVLAAVLLVPLLGSVAGAAPRPYCHVLRDELRDTGQQETVADGTTSDVDLVGGDLATDATRLTAVIRLRDLTPDDPTAAYQGKTYELWFDLDAERHYFFEASFNSDTSGFRLNKASSGWVRPEDERTGAYGEPQVWLVAQAAGVVDTKANEIRLTVPLKVFGLSRAGLRKGTRLFNLGAYTSRSFGDYPGSPVPSTIPLPGGDDAKPVMHPGNAWDAANGTRTDAYVVGAPSCVNVGR
jgi:hypothetical protein